MFCSFVFSYGRCSIVKKFEFYPPPFWSLCKKYRIIGIDICEHCLAECYAQVVGMSEHDPNDCQTEHAEARTQHTLAAHQKKC